MGSIVVMGVSGCGKSSLALALAAACGLPMIEGDAHHSEANLQRMRQGIALTDADRAGWLAVLAGLLAARPGGVVLSCSALKRAYRDGLRAASPQLGFVFLEIPRDLAAQRVAARGPAHFFSSSLVDSQFDALEPPLDEPGVLTLDALRPVDALVRETLRWTRPPHP